MQHILLHSNQMGSFLMPGLKVVEQHNHEQIDTKHNMGININMRQQLCMR